MSSTAARLVWRCAPLFIAGASVTCTKAPTRDLSATDSIVAANSCDSAPVRLVRTADSLSARQACALVSAALKRLAVATPAELPEPPAPSSVDAAAIDLMSERDFSGAEKGVWWVVTLYVPAASTNVEVRFQRADGSTSVRPVHK